MSWLGNLKVNDPVVVLAGGVSSGCYVSRVERLTKTLIVTQDGRKFRRKDGNASGDGYHRGWVEEPTPENLQQVEESVRENKQARMASRLRYYPWHKTSLEVLEAVEKSLPNDSA